MPAYVALLRGVNVGKGRRVPMAPWRDLLAGLGYTEVATLLNSGNAVFCAAGKAAPARHAAAIAQAIAQGLGVEVPVVVKSGVELAAIARENPFASVAPDPARLLVAFAQDAPALASLAPVGALAVPPDAFALGRHAAYLHCPAGILQSKAGEALLGKAGKGATTRNWATVQKLQALLGERGR